MKNVVFIFPGQGSQSVGMGKDFFDNSNIAKELIEQASNRLQIDFQQLLFEKNDKLGQPQYTQPAILLVSSIALQIFRQKYDIKPKFLLGHSLGEFSALVASGALDIIDAVELVHKRGLFMSQACDGIDAGMMAIVGLDDATVEQISQEQREQGKKIWAANYNMDGQIVVAGIKSDLESLVDTYKEAGAKRAMLLDMSVASHCPLLESASAPLEAKLKEMLKDDFIAPVISNVTAKAYNTKEEALSLLPQQLVKPVLYKHSMANIDDEVDCYIEFGQGAVLKGLNRKATKKPHFNVSDMASLEATIEAIKAL